MKVRVDDTKGLEAGKAIEVYKSNQSSSGLVSVTIWNGDIYTSVELTGERARQVAMALIVAFGGGGDAG
jgi:hypothetical protein